MFKIRSGGGYVIASRCHEILSGFCSPGADNSSADAAFVNRRGQAAAALSDPTGQVTIVGFSSKGERTVLDSGPVGALPPSSLALDHSHATWTHSGQPGSADLAG